MLQQRMPKGEIITKRLPTPWYFWRCPEKGCKTELKATVEQFVIRGAQQHQDKHQRDREKAAEREKARQQVEGQLALARGN